MVDESNGKEDVMTKGKTRFSGLLAMTALLLGLALSPALARERTARFAIANMTCASCPVIVKRAMAGVDGVRSVSVSFEKKEAVVVYDDARTNPKTIAEASTRHGYPARLVAEDAPSSEGRR